MGLGRGARYRAHAAAHIEEAVEGTGDRGNLRVSLQASAIRDPLAPQIGACTALDPGPRAEPRV